MTIRRRKDMASRTRIGDVVRSVPIGRCPEFVGSISAVWKWFVHVEDSAGREWHRSWGDLREVEGCGEGLQ